ncbi:PadR family transcriptional regulator [Tsukamurella soli]|uniref:PadR family transcriptional regulator n=1 Tax=Tsukamurella soli TaxID=644556 RepID=A0ABP8JDW2_9ACTN
MALEHAILVSLSERSGTGYQLTRRFDRSIGYFWRATHQQIYRTLARMADQGLVTFAEQPQEGKPDKKVYSVTDTGRAFLSDWIAAAGTPTYLRDELAVKIRGATPGDLPALVDEIRRHRDAHAERAELYRTMEKLDYSDPSTLTGHALQQFLVLRGGVVLEEGLVGWLDEVHSALSRDLTQP